MVRPRTLLLSYFPQSSIITQEIASQALRDAGGDTERARESLEELVRQGEESKNSNRDHGLPSENNTNDVKSAANVRELQQPTLNSATKENVKGDDNERRPPNSVAVIHNLSDRQYCCVWSVEVYDDGYRPEVARTLLAQIAHHVNPILRARGWRVKRLMESASTTFIGCCTGNGRYDADAASTNIQLNLRIQPNKHCTVFRTFSQLLSVMLHEITHTSIGLEDIHPPAFYELMNEIKLEYREKLQLGEVDLETDMYGCDAKVVAKNGHVMTIAEAAADIVPSFLKKTVTSTNDHSFVEDECGVKRLRRRRRRMNGKRKSKIRKTDNKQPPLLKGAKMIDKRTVTGKRLLTESTTLSRRELAARAAMARFHATNGLVTEQNVVIAQGDHTETTTNADNGCSDDSSNNDSDDDEDDYNIQPHQSSCACRSCDWDRLLFMPPTNPK